MNNYKSGTMKNRFKILVIGLTLGFIIGFSAIGFTQPPPPPAGHGSSGDQSPGGTAPIGSGLVILLGLGAAYGGKKIFQAWRKVEE